MNCKPGDLAQVVRCSSRSVCDRSHIGRTIIKVTTSFEGPLGGMWWYYEQPLKPCPLSITGHCKVLAFPDADLKPLPPPEEVDDTSTEEPVKRVRSIEDAISDLTNPF